MKSRPKIEEWLGVACMVVLTLITLGNVLTRYLTDESFAWTEEISVFLIVVMTLAGAASVAGRDGHIRIEFFYDRGSAARRRVLRLLAAVATVLVFAVLAVLFGDHPRRRGTLVRDLDGPRRSALVVHRRDPAALRRDRVARRVGRLALLARPGRALGVGRDRGAAVTRPGGRE